MADGIRAALAFLSEIRRDAELKLQIEALEWSGSLADLVRLGAARGLSFSEAEAKTAIRHDWNMRWHRAST